MASTQSSHAARMGASPYSARWSAEGAEPPLATVVYRSRSVVPLSEAGLAQLVESAQRRNRAESVTGLLIYDDGRFLQWLEGPAAGVARVWESTRHDPRHTAIEVLGDAPTPVRFFPDWDMKLGTRAAHGRKPTGDALALPTRLIAALSRQPDSVRSVLSALQMPAPPDIAATDQARLRSLVDRVVVPRLVAQRHDLRDAALSAAPAPDPRLAALARLLVAADPAEAFALLDALNLRAGSLAASCAEISEPTARCLGDLWAADDCSEFDMTIGLARLQQAFRRLCRATPQHRPTDTALRAVLIAPQPGEMHILGAILDAEMLWRAGWDAHCEFPADDHALQALVAGTWFDAIDLCSSPSLRREHRLGRMAESIAAVRAASCNPGVKVVVGGRAYVDAPAAACVGAARVGADAAGASASQVVRLVDHALGPVPAGRLQ